jgi:transposase
MSEETSHEPEKAPPSARRTRPSAEEREQVLRFHQAGYGTRRIARRLGRSRKAIRCLLAEADPRPHPARPQVRKLEGFQEAIAQKVAGRLTVSRILREIRETGYRGGRTILADYVRGIRGPRRKKPRVKRRFQTDPAQECQIDYSPYRVKLAGTEVTVHGFSAVLHHSRYAYARMVLDERLPTVLECVVGAFEYFEGVPRKLVLDRISAAVFGRLGRDRKVLWHPAFEALCKHYGAEPFLCQAGDPDRKGAVENFIGYIERDRIRDSAWPSLAAMDRDVRTWLDETANRRTHDTTGEVPVEAWRTERDFLTRLPEERFPYWREETRSVADDATLSVAGTHYTVPAELAPGTVRVRLYAAHFEVLGRGGEVAMSRPYAEGPKKGRLVIDEAHYDSLGWPPKGTTDGRTRQLEQRLLVRFADLAALVEGIRSRTKGAWPLHLAKLVKLARRYGEAPFREAALRAQAHGAFNVEAVRRILEREHPLVDEEVLPPARSADHLQRTLGDVDGGDLAAYGDLDTLTGDGDEEDAHGR